MKPDAVEAEAIAAMLRDYAHNPWMVGEHWPLIAAHVQHMLRDVREAFPKPAGAKVLDVGCYNGYISLLFAKLGYAVTGADMFYDEIEQQPLLKANGVDYLSVNFNHLQPFRALPDASFDVVVIAQVIEHILNHPAGLMADMARVLKPGGLFIVTTPNPSTLTNAVRLLREKPMLWGSADFIALPKIEDGEITSKADIHYHEYTRDELIALVQDAGLRCAGHRYLGLGATPSQSRVKQLVKNSPLMAVLNRQRLFASNHYLWARKAA